MVLAEETEGQDFQVYSLGEIAVEGSRSITKWISMIGATYQLKESVKVFASIARKTRFPTLSQVYSGEDPDTGEDSANLDLEAEKSTLR